MNILNRLSLKHRLSLVVGIAIALVIAFLLVLGQHLYDQRNKDFQHAYTQGQKNLWEAVSGNERATMAGNFKNLTRNRKLNNALFRDQLDKLPDAVGPTATRLQAMGIADNLMIVTKDGRIGFTEQKNVSAPAATAKRVLETGKQAGGLDLTSDGRLVNLVAFPLLDRSDLVGVGVFEKSLQSILEQMKSANGRDFVVLDRNNRQHAATTDRIPEFSEGIPEQETYGEIGFDERILGVASLPLADAGGNPIAVMHTFEDVTEAATARRQLALAEIGAAAGMLLLSLVSVSLFMGKTLKPLDQCIIHMERIAGGDLSQEISCERNDEFRRLLDGMKTMNTDLRSLVGNIAGTADEVATTVNQVLNGSRETNRHVSEQRSGLEQLATALNQMTATAGEVTMNISQLAVSADQSLTATNEGNRLVKQSVQGIEALTGRIREGGESVRNLEEKSERIGVVVEVIKTIAEQTNLLALNAAIEAARAGDKGRGFAVVADEVRTLAARTQDSTTEIEEIIGAVQSGVSQAVNVMDQSVEQAVKVSEQASTINQALESIQGQVSTITGLSAQVATASEQQRATTEDMNRNVHSISEMADATAVHADQSAQAVERLVELSEMLRQETGRFKIG